MPLPFTTTLLVIAALLSSKKGTVALVVAIVLLVICAINELMRAALNYSASQQPGNQSPVVGPRQRTPIRYESEAEDGPWEP